MLVAGCCCTGRDRDDAAICDVLGVRSGSVVSLKICWLPNIVVLLLEEEFVFFAILLDRS